LITEITLRSLFSRFGVVADVAIKKIQFNPRLRIQNGYGFVHFPLTADGINAAIAATNLIRQYTIDRVTYDSCLTRSLEYVIATQKDVLPLIEPIRTPGEMMQQQQHHFQQQQLDSPQFASAQRSPHGAMDNRWPYESTMAVDTASPRIFQTSSRDSVESGSGKYDRGLDVSQFNHMRPSQASSAAPLQMNLAHLGMGQSSPSFALNPDSPSMQAMGERKSDDYSFSAAGGNSYPIMRKHQQVSPRSSFNSGYSYSGHSIDALNRASMDSGHSSNYNQQAASPTYLSNPSTSNNNPFQTYY
jgi:hypothetical protein